MIGVHELTRAYDGTLALDHVSFEVHPGRMTGFVGANGAGKTTTMRIVMGVLAATSGEVTWNGEPVSVAQRRTFGYLPEERGLYPKMRVLDQLVFFGRLHAQSAAEASTRARELLGRLDLEQRATDVLETLSLGNQQRVQVAAALMHHPSALVLDEPFSGLDPLAVDAMVGLLRDEVTAEVPVLFSSHQLDLVERLCDDLVILSGGRLVAAGPVEGLRQEAAERYRVVLAGGGDAGALRNLRGLTVLEVEGSRALLELGPEPPEQVLEAVLGVGPVAEFARVVRPLSQIYREAVA